MARELERFLTDKLAQLPPDHPDRRFLRGIYEAVTGYVEQTDPDPGPVPSPAGEQPDSVPLAQSGPEAAPAVERERVRLSGRIGAPPRFSDTPRGVRRAEFNLAVHNDDDSTTWHTVLAFRQRAEQLEQANPQKGQHAEVIGYRHVQERKDRQGKPKTVERIVAAHLRLR